jgi:hypothetical protein
LPAEHDQLVPQDEQFDVFGELTAPAPDQHPEHSQEGEIGERKEHPAILPSHPISRRAAASGGSRLRNPARIWYSRARETK